MTEASKRLWTKVLAIDMLMICVSFSISIVGQMFDAIKEAYALSLSEAGVLLSVQSIGGFIVAIVLILFIDAFEKKKVIVFSGILLSLFLIGVGIKLPLPLLFFVFIMLGFFTGMVNTLVNAVMADTVSHNTERYMVFMHVLFCVGAILGPIIAYLLYTRTGLSGAFFVMGGAALVWSIYAATVFRQNVRKKLVRDKINIKNRIQEMVKVLKIPGMKEIAFISFLALSWQLTATYYISSFFSAVSGNSADGARALSFFFLGLLISRLLFTKKANVFSQGRVLAIGSALAFASWIATMLVTDILIKTILLGVTSLFCGNNTPICFSAACKLSPQNTATASGIVIFGYYLALSVSLPMFAALGENMGLNNSLMIAGIPLVLLIPFALRLHTKMKAIKE